MAEYHFTTPQRHSKTSMRCLHRNQKFKHFGELRLEGTPRAPLQCTTQDCGAAVHLETIQPNLCIPGAQPVSPPKRQGRAHL